MASGQTHAGPQPRAMCPSEPGAICEPRQQHQIRAGLEPVSANYAASPRASALLHSCLLYFFFLVAKSKSNQNKRPSQHLNNSQRSARRANNCVQGSWRWLNEEFSASGFTQGHEDQQITNRAEPLQAAEGRKPARGCSCAAAWPRSVPWPARSPRPHQPPSDSSTEQQVKL